MKLGIDFGTSFSLPATQYRGEGYILLPGGTYGIPSVFYYDSVDDLPLVGTVAEDAGQGENSSSLIREIKMSLSSNVKSGGKTFSGSQVAGYILAKVKEIALSTAEEKAIDERLEGVVISVPAAFGHNEKELILQAARMPESEGGPGFNILGLVKEPVAAALAYFKASLADHTQILVYDLGGGTCDVAIVEADSTQAEKYRVIDADMKRIGGRDWDKRLADYIAHEIQKQAGINVSSNSAYMERIKRAAVKVKHDFSEKIAGKYRDKVSARIDIEGRTRTVQVTKTIFDELTSELFLETVKLTQQLITRNPGVNISKFICVGGSSNMPQVKEGIRSAFPDFDIRIYEPEKAIAYGASIYAESCGTGISLLSDIAPFSYGIRTYQDYKRGYEIIVNLIRKADRLPKTQSHYFYTLADNQPRVSFKVYESDIKEDRYDYVYDDKNEPIMDVILEIPPIYPKDTRLSVDMTLTESGIIEVTAKDENGHTQKGRKQLHF